MIQIKKLNKSYGKKLIFNQTSFDFPNTGLVCVLGPSGCGKSTLFNLMAGFDTNYEGEIVVHGKLLSELNEDELCSYRRNHIGFVFQNYHLIRGYTAKENVMMAVEAIGGTQKEQEVMDLFSQLDITSKADQKIETLSGGQKQRVAIARAIINHPSIIFADEPTGALDRNNSNEIMELLKNLSEKRLVVVITHDKKCAEYANQIVTIQNGKLICETNISKEIEDKYLKLKEAPKINIWKRAFKNFQVHLKRYGIVALAISIGILCFSLSLSSKNVMKQSIADFEAKNTAYHNGFIKAEGNAEEILDILHENHQLTNVYSQYKLKEISLKVEGKIEIINEKYPISKAKQSMSYGVMPRDLQNEIAISPSLAAKYDKNIQNLIGKQLEISLNDKSYLLTISGIFNSTYDDFIMSSDVEQLLYQGNLEPIYSISYDVIDFDQIVNVNEQIAKQGLKSQNASDEVKAFLLTFEKINHLFTIIACLIFFVGLIISGILLFKQQQTRYSEVGLLSALGYSKKHIRKIFMAEGLYLTGLSIICSVILIGIIFFVQLPIKLSNVQIVLALCLTGCLIILLSYITSIQLIKTEPAVALRKK